MRQPAARGAVSGLCGIVDFGGAPVHADHLRRMTAAAAHRGPDGTGGWLVGGAGLVHLALCTTPESTRERQPLEDPDTGLVLVADARIDNRDELIAALPPDAFPRGRLRRPGPTDADLILAAHRHWGARGMHRLVGDFAFALWDTRARRLYAARDAMGMRPLHYRWDGQRIFFASDVAQLLAIPGFDATLFEPALAAHLLGFFDKPQWTPYEGIVRLPPAHALVVDTSGPSVTRFWDVDPARAVRYRTDDEYTEHFREVFTEAVKSRLRSTRPIGIMLSGGLDSGAVASTAGKLLRDGAATAREVRAYSWAFEELRAADERHLSDIIVDHYGLASTNVPADDLWPLSTYPQRGPDVDDPFVGVYQALLEHALELARSEGMGLMLSGNRGDLLVGGDVHDAPGMIRAGHWRSLLADIGLYRRWMRLSPAETIRRLVVLPVLSDMAALPPFVPLRTEWRRRRSAQYTSSPPWVRPELLERTGLDVRPPAANEPPEELRGAARRQRYRLIFSGMQMSTLTWEDRLHARAHMQFADPWSDRRLTELVLAMPQRVVQHNGELKRIAREAMRGVMPEEVRRGATKISPYPLFRRALDGAATATIDDLLTGSVSASMGLIDEERLRAHYADVLAGGREAAGFWWALGLEMWLRRLERPLGARAGEGV